MRKASVVFGVALIWSLFYGPNPASASTLDIEQGSPAFSPYEIAAGGSFTVNFTVYLYDLNSQGQEIPAANVTSQSYTLSTPDNQGVISNVSASGFTVSGAGTNSVTLTKSGGNSGASFAVSASIEYPDTGDQSASLTGSFQTSDRITPHQLSPRIALPHMLLASFTGRNSFTNRYVWLHPFFDSSPIFAFGSGQISKMPVLGGPISGGNDVRYYADGSAPTVTLYAAGNQPQNTIYTWTLSDQTNDGNLFMLDANGVPQTTITGSQYTSVTLKGVAPPTYPYDSGVTLYYTTQNNKQIFGIKDISVRTPNSVVHPSAGALSAQGCDPATPVIPPTAVFKNIKGYDDTLSWGFQGEGIWWQVLDQFGNPLDGVQLGEHWTNISASTKYPEVGVTPWPGPKDGDPGGVTGSEGIGSYPDPYSVGGFGQGTPPSPLTPGTQEISASQVPMQIGTATHNLIAQGASVSSLGATYNTNVCNHQ